MIGEDQWIAMIGTLGAVVLVGAALLQRRRSTRVWIAQTAIWAAIILGLWAAVTIGLDLAHRPPI